MIEVLLPIKTVSVMNAREHFQARARRAKLHRQTAWAMLKPYAVPALPVTVTMIRVGFGTLDGDNLQSAGKAARDGVADWLGVDDGDPRITWNYQQQKAKRGEYGLIVRVV
jgi:hypothetical protein